MYVVKTRAVEDVPTGNGVGVRVRARPLSRQQARTAATREKLLAAAARIFAREGFEAARLEDIAAAAGYTRGAFYANFKDKEELFFALLERWVAQRMAEVGDLLARTSHTPAEQLRALRDYYAGRPKERRIGLLSLEFILYAIRHPAAHARLRARIRRMRCRSADLVHRIAESEGRSLPVHANAAVAALGAFSNGLFLERLVDPERISDSDVQHLLGIVFDAIASARAAAKRQSRA